MLANRYSGTTLWRFRRLARLAGGPRRVLVRRRRLDEDDELDASWKFGPSDDGSFDRRECASFDSTESGVTAVSAGG